MCSASTSTATRRRRATLDRIYALAIRRPILIGEFHIGVPERGLAPGLVQAMNQEERGIAYRYYVEQVRWRIRR